MPVEVTRLPRVVKLQEHESADSALVRLATANGFGKITSMLRATPNFPSKLCNYDLTEDRCIILLERLAGIPKRDLLRQTPVRSLGSITLYGHEFRRFRSIGPARVCFQCVSNDRISRGGIRGNGSFRRNWWELHNIGVCPEHATRLLDHCPKCRFRFRRLLPVGTCSCGFAAEQVGSVDDPIPQHHIIHDRWLLRRLGITDGPTHEFLDTLPPDIGSSLCLIIGEAVSNDYKISRTQALRPLYSADMRSIGWHAMHNWPHSFRYFLDSLVAKNLKGKKSIRTAMYSGLSNQLIKLGGSDLEPVFDEIRRHIRSTTTTSSKTRVAGQFVGFSETIAIHHAAVLIACGPGRFTEICDRLNVLKFSCSQSGVNVIYKDDLERIRNFWLESIEAVRIAKVLKCNYKTIDRMIGMNFLRVKISGRAAVSPLVEREDFDMIMEAVTKPLPELSEPGEDYITLRRAVRIVWGGEATILKGLMLGMIQSVGRSPGEVGFKGMIFSKRNLLDSLENLTGKISCEEGLRTYRLQAGTILFLKRNGYISSEPRYYVERSELEGFLANHVSLADMAKWQPGCTPHEIKRTLRAAGVEPEIAPQRHVTAFWRKEPALRALGHI